MEMFIAQMFTLGSEMTNSACKKEGLALRMNMYMLVSIGALFMNEDAHYQIETDIRLIVNMNAFISELSDMP
jgi:hypothetical protein